VDSFMRSTPQRFMRPAKAAGPRGKGP